MYNFPLGGHVNKCHEIRQSLHAKDNLKLLLMVNNWSSSKSQNLSHISVISPLTCTNLNLAIQMLFSLPLSSYLWHSKLSYANVVYLPSYLWQFILSHTNVVYLYLPLTCGTLILAIQMWYIFPFTCGKLTLAIHMLYILLLTVAF